MSQKVIGRFAAGLLASTVIGFLTIGAREHAAEPPAFPTPASLEMMQLLRDEHGLIVDMVKAQLATAQREPQRQRAGSADADATLAAIEPPQGDHRSLRARGRRNI
jgi:hypothetical protein